MTTKKRIKKLMTVSDLLCVCVSLNSTFLSIGEKNLSQAMLCLLQIQSYLFLCRFLVFCVFFVVVSLNNNCLIFKLYPC